MLRPIKIHDLLRPIYIFDAQGNLDLVLCLILLSVLDLQFHLLQNNILILF